MRLNNAPTEDDHATTKNYVDTAVGEVSTALGDAERAINAAIALKADTTALESAVNTINQSITTVDTKAQKGVDDAKTAKDAADAAQADADTNALNIQEIEKELNGYTVGEGESAQTVDGLITKVANNTARIATAEGTIGEHTTAIGNNATAAQNAQNKADQAYTLAESKADDAATTAALNLKADKTELTTAINGVNEEIGKTNAEVAKKAATTYVDEELAKKADKETTYTKTEVDETVAGINAEVAKKAVKTEVEEALNLKANTEDVYTIPQIDGQLSALRSDVTEDLGNLDKKAQQGIDDAAEAKGVADAAKARIDAFIDGTAEAESAIDTLVEIQQYMTADTEAFTALSGRVTKIEDGTTVVPKAADAGLLNGKADTAFATAEQGTKADNAAAAIATYGDIVTHNVNEFATAAQGTKADDAAAAIATYGDIVTHDADEFATAAQGAKADTAIQSVTSLHDAIVVTPGENGAITINFASEIILNGGGADVAVTE